MRKIPLRQSSLSSSALSASASLRTATSLSRHHLSQSPPPLSVVAITDSAQQFAAISSFYLPLFLSIRKLNWQQLVQISKRFLEQFAAFLPLSETEFDESSIASNSSSVLRKVPKARVKW
ncbi:uncharacterized protein LOC110771574 isoform X2 [Prunus avium]|uniref:Uncharacterized protein LOC110771574 isoform X2 n=1 Tax=Prunus avium TaxID=42229 RepID=A0A6P5TY23_PRUAV|nr:uncharacterized protein LOC110771574 isoform X2 [Prunus avium]